MRISYKPTHKRKRLGAWILEDPEKLKHQLVDKDFVFADKDFIRQNLNIIVLTLLKLLPMSGHDIIKIINNVSDVLPSSGTIYPLLQSFEENGLISKIASDGKDIRYKVANNKKVDKILNDYVEEFKTLENLIKSAR